MLLELLLVLALFGVLHTRGLVDLGNPWAVAGIALACAGAAIAAGLVCRLVANAVTDSLFGFGAWSPQSRSAVAAARKARDVKTLEQLARKSPRDAEVSRLLAELYLQRGDLDKFLDEKRRILENGTLTTSEMVCILHRLADVELQKGRPEEALRYLEMLTSKFPGTSDAANAKRRCVVISEQIAAGASKEGGA